MVRSVVVALLVGGVAAGGCSAETVLRITVQPGVDPPPASLLVTLVGNGITAPTRTITPVTLPGTVVVHGLPDNVSDVCVQTEGLAVDGSFLVGGSVTVELVPHHTTATEVQMSNAFVRCPELAQDLGTGSPPDLATPLGPDGGAAECPVGAIFCDDFESDTLAKWTQETTHDDLGSLDVQSSIVAHGSYALHAAASGSSGMNEIAEIEYDFAARQPPLALRANVYAPQTLHNYTIVMSLYDSTTHGFAIGGDSDSTWVLTEDDTTDHHSDMVPASGGQWHCLEIVIDSAGQVTAYVDEHALIGPVARTSNVAYSAFLVGVDRTVLNDTNVFVDDVAIGTSRLYCPK